METRKVDDRIELFVDEWLIDRLDNAHLKLHSPDLKEIALNFDKPWERQSAQVLTVVRDDNGFKLYYHCGGEAGRSLTCCALSLDGTRWERPSLDFFKWQEEKDNNIIFLDEGCIIITAFLDGNPDSPADQRYKGCSLHDTDDYRGVMLYASSDGLRWRRLQEECALKAPRKTEPRVLDAANQAYWDPIGGRYLGYVRFWRDQMIRDIRVAQSDDFIHWSEPVPLDFGDAPVEHLYESTTMPYFRAPHIKIGFPKRFMPHRRFNPNYPHTGICDTVFMSSRDGLKWDRRFMEAFLRPGLDTANWSYHSPTLGTGVWPINEQEMVMFVTEHYLLPSARMRRATMRIDGFVSVSAPYRGGEMTTQPFNFTGGRLVINYSTSAAGSIRVELQDETGRPIPGFRLQESEIIYGDEIEHTVFWEGGGNISRFAASPKRLRFVMEDADLYSIRFKQWDEACIPKNWGKREKIIIDTD